MLNHFINYNTIIVSKINLNYKIFLLIIEHKVNNFMIIKKHITFSERKKSDAQNDIEAEKTAGKILRDTIIETGVGLVREKAYVASNKTDKLL